MTLNDQILQIQMNLDQAKEHVVQLEAGRKSASCKARSCLQKIKVIAHELRKQCCEQVKTIPVKSRVKVKVVPTEVLVSEPVAEPVLPSEPVAAEPVVSEPVVSEPVSEPVAEPVAEPVVVPKKSKRLKKTR